MKFSLSVYGGALSKKQQIMAAKNRVSKLSHKRRLSNQLPLKAVPKNSEKIPSDNNNQKRFSFWSNTKNNLLRRPSLPASAFSKAKWVKPILNKPKNVKSRRSSLPNPVKPFKRKKILPKSNRRPSLPARTENHRLSVSSTRTEDVSDHSLCSETILEDVNEKLENLDLDNSEATDESLQSPLEDQIEVAKKYDIKDEDESPIKDINLSNFREKFDLPEPKIETAGGQNSHKRKF